MGGKGSAPKAPDYVGAAQLQGELSKEALMSQNYANRPEQNTPFGSTTWSTRNVKDPSTGQDVTSWTQNTTLDPQLQNALNDQLSLQAGRSNLASGFMSRVGTEYAQPFDWNSLPRQAQLGGASQLNTGMADYTPGLTTGIQNPNLNTSFASRSGELLRTAQTEPVQRSLMTGDNPALPQMDASYRDRVATDLMTRMAPMHQLQQRDLETRLANQGFGVGSEGYKRALDELNQRQAGERFNALDMAGQEAQRLFNMGMGARQQAFQEDVTGGQFANQAAQQAFGQQMTGQDFVNRATQQAFDQDMAARQAENQARSGQFGQNLSAAQFGNQALGQAGALDLQRMNAMNQAASQQQQLNMQFADQQNRLRQQAIAEQMQRRGMSLNEMNALLSGQQVAMPQMPSFTASGRAETPNILGATQMGYDAALGAYNAQQAGAGNFMSGLFGLGSAALGNPYGLFSLGGGR